MVQKVNACPFAKATYVRCTVLLMQSTLFCSQKRPILHKPIIGLQVISILPTIRDNFAVHRIHSEARFREIGDTVSVSAALLPITLPSFRLRRRPRVRLGLDPVGSSAVHWPRIRPRLDSRESVFRFAMSTVRTESGFHWKGRSGERRWKTFGRINELKLNKFMQFFVLIRSLWHSLISWMGAGYRHVGLLILPLLQLYCVNSWILLVKEITILMQKKINIVSFSSLFWWNSNPGAPGTETCMMTTRTSQNLHSIHEA